MSKETEDFIRKLNELQSDGITDETPEQRLKRVESVLRKSTDRVMKVEKEHRNHGKLLTMMLRWFRFLGFKPKSKRRPPAPSSLLPPDEVASFKRQMAGHGMDEEETRDTRVMRAIR